MVKAVVLYGPPGALCPNGTRSAKPPSRTASFLSELGQLTSGVVPARLRSHGATTPPQVWLSSDSWRPHRLLRVGIPTPTTRPTAIVGRYAVGAAVPAICASRLRRRLPRPMSKRVRH